MNALKKKLGKNGGFTLIEMLIVVAIIAILIAVSIPLINSALERARMATDAANERAAKAEGVILYLNSEDGTEVAGSYTFNAEAGTLDPNEGEYGYGRCNTYGHSGETITVTIGDDGEVEIGWTAGDNHGTSINGGTTDPDPEVTT